MVAALMTGLSVAQAQVVVKNIQTDSSRLRRIWAGSTFYLSGGLVADP